MISESIVSMYKEHVYPKIKRFGKLFDAFQNNKKGLYLIGGSVRDIIMGKEPKDFDFATNALPEETKQILFDIELKPFCLGEKFGTISAYYEDQLIEITTFRKDISTGRHPEVSFDACLTDDVNRRDFTMNALAVDSNGSIIDAWDSQKHISYELIKAVGDPEKRFREDPLRMLRAVRFVSQLGFDIEENTRQAIKSNAFRILDISRERWFAELDKLLLGEFVYDALEELLQLGLLGYILPEVYPITLRGEEKLYSKNLWEHTKIVVSKSVNRSIVRWSALLHDIGKPQTRSENGVVRFFGHEKVGAELARNICERLNMSKSSINNVCGLVLLHQKVGDSVLNGVVSLKAIRNLAKNCEKNKCDLNDLVDLFHADCSGHLQVKHNSKANLIREIIGSMKKEDLLPKLPAGIGNVIKERFNVESEKIGELKRILENALVIGTIKSSTTIEDMMKFLENIVNSSEQHLFNNTEEEYVAKSGTF